MKLANPLQYPLVVLSAGILLILGARLLRAPVWLMLPIAAGSAIVGSSVVKSRQTETFEIEDPDLERELRSVQAAVSSLKTRADLLRTEAARLLTESFQLDLLATVNMACDRVAVLPDKLQQLGRFLQNTDSVLSVDEICQQLKEAKQSLSLAEAQQQHRSSSGIAKQHFTDLIASLERNLQLAQDGKDTRLAQVVHLSRLTQDLGGMLQQFQNRLRLAELQNADKLGELQDFSQELLSVVDNMDVLIRAHRTA
jgi:hypothetical protein